MGRVTGGRPERPVPASLARRKAASQEAKVAAWRRRAEETARRLAERRARDAP